MFSSGSQVEYLAADINQNHHVLCVEYSDESLPFILGVKVERHSKNAGEFEKLNCHAFLLS